MGAALPGGAGLKEGAGCTLTPELGVSWEGEAAPRSGPRNQPARCQAVWQRFCPASWSCGSDELSEKLVALVANSEGVVSAGGQLCFMLLCVRTPHAFRYTGV